MPSPTSLLGTVAVGLFAASITSVDALPSFLKLMPGSQNVPGIEAIGHVLTGGGGARNAFGEDFDSAGRKWTEALCYSDSDSDGQFNGAELGDPCCEWVQDTNEKLAYTTATAPGDKTSKQDPTIWASVKCADGSSPETKYEAFANATSAKEVGDAPASTVPSPTKKATPAPAPAATSGAANGQTLAGSAVVAVLLAVGLL